MLFKLQLTLSELFSIAITWGTWGRFVNDFCVKCQKHANAGHNDERVREIGRKVLQQSQPISAFEYKNKISFLRRNNNDEGKEGKRKSFSKQIIFTSIIIFDDKHRKPKGQLSLDGKTDGCSSSGDYEIEAITKKRKTTKKGAKESAEETVRKQEP